MMYLAHGETELATRTWQGARALLVPTLKLVSANPCSLHP